MRDERDKTTKSKRVEELLEGKEEDREEKAMSRRKRRRQKEKDKKKIQLDKEKEGEMDNWLSNRNWRFNYPT